MEYLRSLAKVYNSDIKLESDHGWLMWTGHFDYEDCGCQGFGYYMHDSFIRRFLRVFGEDQTIHGLNGRSCWVTHSNSDIIKIEPLHKKDGKAFDIRKWQIEMEPIFDITTKMLKKIRDEAREAGEYA